MTRARDVRKRGRREGLARAPLRPLAFPNIEPPTYSTNSSACYAGYLGGESGENRRARGEKAGSRLLSSSLTPHTTRLLYSHPLRFNIDRCIMSTSHLSWRAKGLFSRNKAEQLLLIEIRSVSLSSVILTRL